MTAAIRYALIGISCVFVSVGLYHRIRSEKTRERLDRSKEGWRIFAGIRLSGLATLGITAAWLRNPGFLRWATVSVPEWARWIGVAGFALCVCWLIWMFISLGTNLTDTVVTRRAAYFVDSGPYRFVRNPMYTGVLFIGPSLGLALGTWLVPLGTTVIFALMAKRTDIEERYLIARFGNQYSHYIMRVGRFLPRLRGKKYK
jgi:protein-S-isoprenylcysteine O-methyltransferase Ste14